MRCWDVAIILGFTLMAGSLAAASPAGVWGGDRTNLTLGPEGGRLQQECAFASFGPVQPNAEGMFEADGSFEEETAGPQQADATRSGKRAHFKGHISGRTMHLVVQVPGRPDQQLTLVQGQRAKMVRCL